MQAVKSKDTKPEMRVRRLLHTMGYRYRLHRKNLPGKPDIVFPSRKKVIFVHGCFWHSHGCKIGQPPKSRTEYWQPKLAQNVQRDRTKEEHLRALGWDVLVIWQCETRVSDALAPKLISFLEDREEPIDKRDDDR